MMLRVVLTLDCDRCKESYPKAAVSTDPRSVWWECIASDLKGAANFDGWVIGESIGMLCNDCVEGLEAVANSSTGRKSSSS